MRRIYEGSTSTSRRCSPDGYSFTLPADDTGAPEGLVLGDVVLGDTATVRGRAVDSNGDALSEARLAAAGKLGDFVFGADAIADSDGVGRFVLTGVLAGRLTVVGSAPELASAGTITEAVAGEDLDVGDIVLLPVLPLEGNVDVTVTLGPPSGGAARIVLVRAPDDIARDHVFDNFNTVSVEVPVAPGVQDFEARAGNIRGLLPNVVVENGAASMFVHIELDADPFRN